MDFTLPLKPKESSHLNMPVFSESCDYALLHRSMTGSTNGDSHRVVTSKTVQLATNFSRINCQFVAGSFQVLFDSKDTLYRFSKSNKISENMWSLKQRQNLKADIEMSSFSSFFKNL